MIWVRLQMGMYGLMFQGPQIVHMSFYPGLNGLWEGVTVQMKKSVLNCNAPLLYLPRLLF